MRREAKWGCRSEPNQLCLGSEPVPLGTCKRLSYAKDDSRLPPAAIFDELPHFRATLVTRNPPQPCSG
jgi:hypothetical protein